MIDANALVEAMWQACENEHGADVLEVAERAVRAYLAEHDGPACPDPDAHGPCDYIPITKPAVAALIFCADGTAQFRPLWGDGAASPDARRVLESFVRFVPDALDKPRLAATVREVADAIEWCEGPGYLSEVADLRAVAAELEASACGPRVVRSDSDGEKPK